MAKDTIYRQLSDKESRHNFFVDVGIESALVAIGVVCGIYRNLDSTNYFRNFAFAMLANLAMVLGLVAGIYLGVTLCWGTLDLFRRISGIPPVKGEGCERWYYFQPAPAVIPGVQYRVSATELVIFRENISPVVIPRAWDTAFAFQGHEIIVGEMRADITGIDHEILRSTLENYGWGFLAQAEPLGNMANLAPAGNGRGWVQPQYPVTPQKANTEFMNYDSALRRNDARTLVNPRFWDFTRVPWLVLLLIFGLVWIIIAAFRENTSDRWGSVSVLIFFVVLSLPIKIIFYDKFPWGRHSSSPLAYTLKIDPHNFVAERGDGRRLVCTTGAPIIWNSVAHTLAVPGYYPEVFARLHAEDFVPIALERGWTVIIDGIAYSLPIVEESSHTRSSSTPFC